MNRHHTVSHTLIVAMGLIFTSCTGPSQVDSTEQNLADEATAIPASTAVGAQIAEYPVSPFEDSQGRMWFGSVSAGLMCYNGEELVYYDESDGLMGKRVLGVVEDAEGNIWCTSAEPDMGGKCAATKFDGATFTNYPLKDDWTGGISNVSFDSEGQMWAMANTGVYKWVGEAFQRVEMPNPSLSEADVSGEVYAPWDMLELENGTTWFGSSDRGAYLWDGENFTHFTTEDGLLTDNVTIQLEDEHGHIWITCYGWHDQNNPQSGGLCIYDGTTFRSFPEIDGLHHTDIYTVDQDASGNIWIGASGHGVYKYDGTEFELFTKSNRPDVHAKWGLQGVFEDSKGRLWFCFCGGLFRLENGVFINVTQEGPWE